MDVGEALARCGGRASARRLMALGVRKRTLAAAVLAEQVVRSRRGHYRSAGETTARDTADEVTGVLPHRSAALALGLEVARAPTKPEVIVRRNRRMRREDQDKVSAYHRDLLPDEVLDGTTTALRTVLDCARDLPFTEALAVADSALRHDLVSPDQLTLAVHTLRGPGTLQALRVARHASRLAANAFESVVRALCLEEGLDVRPQVEVTEAGVWARVDLSDVSRGLIVKAAPEPPPSPLGDTGRHVDESSCTNL